MPSTDLQKEYTFDQMLAMTQRVLAEFDTKLTPQETEVLSYLLMKGKMTAAEVSSVIGIDPTRAYTVLDSLVSKKLCKKVEDRSPKTYLPLHPHYIFSELEKRLSVIKGDIDTIVPICVQIFETSEDFEEPSLGDFLFTSEETSELISDLAPILKVAKKITMGGDLTWIQDQTFLLDRMNKTSVTVYLKPGGPEVRKFLTTATVIPSEEKLPDFIVIETEKALHLIFLVRKYRPDSSFKMHGIRIVDQTIASYFLESLLRQERITSELR